MTQLTDLLERYPQEISGKMLKVFDAFVPRLADQNSKVNVHALLSFSRVIAVLKVRRFFFFCILQLRLCVWWGAREFLSDFVLILTSF